MKFFSLLCLTLLSFSWSMAQNKGTKERIKVYSRALEGNLVNDNPERDVTVYLPPSYNSQTGRHYPVIYPLHGFTDDESKWFGWEEHWINLHEVFDVALAEGQTKEMIVVMPNDYNRFKGSMYSSSVTIGDWETFVAKELVSFIDSSYRTIPEISSRGLAGHSMGGYGTMRLGMKYPEVWSAIYLLSRCMAGTMNDLDPEIMNEVESVTKVEQLEPAGFFNMAILATSAAWSPNPNNPPYYLDLPFKDGQTDPEIAAKNSANRILYTGDQYIYNLKKLKAIGMDAGTEDRGISGETRRLHELLEAYDIPHFYESYAGDHLNRIAKRIRTKTLPFFSENLRFE